ncbi:MAG: hypothetical protein Unbinned5784contig1000_37 [Prokaryotic dsDNA virus sp.]|nr:MAG: hypothetical protein Unbinned5784contig1000_37 [Prokaryotic dsDNA virus sp.]|tara:strand:+ start:2541 stop:2858 length:318 start_codon:yes stop_codon:yes gene_type:complete
MARVTLTLATTTFTGDRNGLVLKPNHKRDELGAMQVEVTAGSCDAVKLQGRLTTAGSWQDIATTGAMGDGAEPTQKLLTDQPILPYMRARLEGGTGATLSAYIME